MSALTSSVCGAPQGGHDGPVRPYHSGPLCSAHSPWAATGLPQPPAPAAPATAPTLLRPDGSDRVRDAVFVDLGEGYEIKKDGPRKGQIWWKREPRARYECLPCQYASPIVTGHELVKTFVATVRAEHRAICPGHPPAIERAA